jgi:ribosomal-protein-alanine N-acetyltransferase
MHHIVDQGHITNLAVSPDCRRRCVARMLMQELICYCRERSVLLLTLEVRASNMAALALYGSLGFVRAGLRKGYYTHPKDDALLLTLYF